MAGPNFKRKLIHQCTIQRNTPSQSTTGELTPSWADIGTVDCRFIERSDRIANEAAGFPVLSTYLMLTATVTTSDDSTVTIEDRVTDVVYKSDDSSLDAGPFTIESLLKRHSGSLHHYSFQLERVK